MKRRVLLLSAVGLHLIGCATPLSNPAQPHDDLVVENLRANELIVSQPQELAAAEKEDEEAFQTELKFADHEHQEAVQRWIEYFTHTDRERFARFLERGQPYKPLVETLLKKQGIPTYFYYLALIESGFQLQATSHAQAVGMWQFIKGTGLRYGLKINRHVDERRDPIRATIAAASYLKDLHNVFQSWFLAMAAYNSGESRVMNTIMKHGSRDFWELASRKVLPRETRNYIPKFIAAALIGSHPEKYGFALPSVTPFPALTSVAVPSPLALGDIAQTLKTPLATLKRYNPNILGEYTNPGQASYRIWIPTEASSHIGALAALKPRAPVRLASPRFAPTYRVRRGDTLASIAQKFGTSITAVKQINHLPGNRIVAGRSIRVPGNAASALARRYRVRQGDNLTDLARRFGMSVRGLKGLNAMQHSRIYAGQVLKVGPSRG